MSSLRVIIFEAKKSTVDEPEISHLALFFCVFARDQFLRAFVRITTSANYFIIKALSMWFISRRPPLPEAVTQAGTSPSVSTGKGAFTAVWSASFGYHYRFLPD